MDGTTPQSLKADLLGNPNTWKFKWRSGGGAWNVLKGLKDRPFQFQTSKPHPPSLQGTADKIDKGATVEKPEQASADPLDVEAGAPFLGAGRGLHCPKIIELFKDSSWILKEYSGFPEHTPVNQETQTEEQHAVSRMLRSHQSLPKHSSSAHSRRHWNTFHRRWWIWCCQTWRC